METGTARQSRVVVNGRSLSADGIPVNTTLLDFLRSQGLTGAKEGCAEGECGACTVAMIDATISGTAYQPVNSCLMLLPGAIDREFITVEGLARRGELCEVQRAMASGGGSQCGYCTPGFVMSLFAEQYRPGRTVPCDPQALGGNLCRCTGYRPIQDAVHSAGPAPQGAFLDRLAEPAPSLQPLNYAMDEIRFERPCNLEECLSIAAANTGVKWISGATDLAVESNLRYRRWPHLVSLEGVPELREFSDGEHSVRIGAALPLSEIDRLWTSGPRAVRAWLQLFASPAIRNRATLGGNLGTASPIGDSAPLLLALDASLVLRSARGIRKIALSTFFTGYRQTLLAPDELIQCIEIPKPYPRFVRFYKVSKRRMDDISTVAAGLSIGIDSGDRIAQVRFAFGGVAAVPLRAPRAESVATGQVWNESSVRDVQEALRSELHPKSDHRGSAEYRLAMSQSLVEKFYWDWRSANA